MPRFASSPSGTFSHGQRRSTIVQAVLTEIFHGRLRAGQRLITQDLADRFGVSHTPIREALIELGALGIIEWHPNRGAVVRPVTSRDVAEVCEVRRLLECEAARAACGRIAPRTLLQLQEQIRRLKAMSGPSRRIVQQACELDNRLHDVIAHASGNSFLAKEIARLKAVFRAFRDVGWELEEARNDYHRVGMEADEHLALLEALSRGSAEEAAQAMAKHIRSGQEYWGRVISALNPGASPSGWGDAASLAGEGSVLPASSVGGSPVSATAEDQPCVE